METTKQKLVASITRRIPVEVSARNPVKFISDIPVEECIDTAIAVIYLYTRSKSRGNGNKMGALMVEVITAIGHGIRNKHKLKRDSSLAAKAGAFILYSFEELGLLRVIFGAANNGHHTYILEVLNDDALCVLWEELDIEKTEKLPSLTPYAAWTSSKHETGASLVKTANKDVTRKLTPETHPIVFNAINKSQQQGWIINEDIYPVYSWALRNKTDAFADIWELQNPEAKQSKIREAKAIGSIAKRFLGSVFYHLYYYDFR